MKEILIIVIQNGYRRIAGPFEQHNAICDGLPGVQYNQLYLLQRNQRDSNVSERDERIADQIREALVWVLCAVFTHNNDYCKHADSGGSFEEAHEDTYQRRPDGHGHL